MRITKDWPVNIDRIREVLNPPATACFTYGSTIHNPSGNELYADLMEHEQVHERQQEVMGPEAWWNKYLDEPDFRLQEEVEAYAVQYNFVKQSRPAKMAKRYLEMFAHHLSTIYKLDIDFHEAFTFIRLKAKEI